MPSGKQISWFSQIKKEQVAVLDQDDMKLSIQFLTLTFAMTALTVSGQCVICSKENKNKPDKLTLMYKSDGKNSDYQDSKKATCREAMYPTSTTIATTNKEDQVQTIDVTDGTVFGIHGKFNSETKFKFENGFACYIHTSCSVPLVAGDQIGPFVILEGNDCKHSVSPSAQPSPSPSAQPTGTPSTPPTTGPSPSPSIHPTGTPSTPPTPGPSPALSSTPPLM